MVRKLKPPEKNVNVTILFIFEITDFYIFGVNLVVQPNLFREEKSIIQTSMDANDKGANNK